MALTLLVVTRLLGIVCIFVASYLGITPADDVMLLPPILEEGHNALALSAGIMMGLSLFHLLADSMDVGKGLGLDDEIQQQLPFALFAVLHVAVRF